MAVIQVLLAGGLASGRVVEVETDDSGSPLVEETTVRVTGLPVEQLYGVSCPAGPVQSPTSQTYRRSGDTADGREVWTIVE